MDHSRRHNCRKALPPLALLLLALALSWALGGCAPAHIPVPENELRQPAEARYKVVNTARSLEGTRYKWGGESPKTGFDCSGFTWWAFRQQGVDLPRISTDQFAAGRPVAERDIRAGDLVFFRLKGAPKGLHVGIATERGTFVHSPREGGRVREDALDAPFWRERFVGARRVVQNQG
jgi:cell wall-associated NlpC family hydrolase